MYIYVGRRYVKITFIKIGMSTNIREGVKALAEISDKNARFISSRAL